MSCVFRAGCESARFAGLTVSMMRSSSSCDGMYWRRVRCCFKKFDLMDECRDLKLEVRHLMLKTRYVVFHS